MNNRPIHLSKSRFLSGLNCLKQLYLTCHQPEHAAPLSVSDEALIETGRKVEELAQQRFPGGVMVEGEKPFAAAQRETKRLPLICR